MVNWNSPMHVSKMNEASTIIFPIAERKRLNFI